MSFYYRSGMKILKKKSLCLLSDVLAYKPFEPLETLLESWKKTNQALSKKIQKN